MLKLGRLKVRLIPPGQKWGPDKRYISNYPMVEFLDPRIKSQGPKGKVVARMHVNHLFLRGAEEGFILDERVPAWSLNALQVSMVRQYIRDSGVAHVC